LNASHERPIALEEQHRAVREVLVPRESHQALGARVTHEPEPMTSHVSGRDDQVLDATGRRQALQLSAGLHHVGVADDPIYQQAHVPVPPGSWT